MPSPRIRTAANSSILSAVCRTSTRGCCAMFRQPSWKIQCAYCGLQGSLHASRLWVFHEGCRNMAQHPRVDVLHTAERIDEFAAVRILGDGIDREVASLQVLLESYIG